MDKPEIEMGWSEPLPINIDTFHERCVKWACDEFAKKTEILTGQFILVAGSSAYLTSRVAIVSAPWTDADEKYAIASAMRRVVQREEILAYCFVTEAWASTMENMTEREDVLFITTMKRSGEQRVTRYGVRYYKNSRKPPRLLERDDFHADKSLDLVGIMYNFFESEEESERKMEAAHARAKAAKETKH